MKKTYMKPELFAESFTLVEHISACSNLHSALSGTPQACGFSLNGPNPGANDPILFLETPPCTDIGDLGLFDPKPGGEYAGGVLCYNYFMDEGTTLFGS